MFWVPSGWVPWYVEWLLAFPRAPRGSVSIQVWGIACAAVVRLVGEAGVAVWKVVMETRGGGEKSKAGVKVEMEAGKEKGMGMGGQAMGVGVGVNGSKKEL